MRTDGHDEAIRDFTKPPIYPGDRGGTVVNPLNAKLNPICWHY